MFNFDKSIKFYAVRWTIKAALISTAAAVPLVLASPQDASAKVTGKCYNCHTMHNSQGTNPMVSGGGGPISSLLINSCVGCHSSAGSSTTYVLGDSTVPVVNYIGSGEPTEYLAGGNFYWVKEGNTNAADSKGHNVFLDEDDDTLTLAPGANVLGCGTDSCHENLSQPCYDSSFFPYVDDGDYGCKGCHLNERHHADDDSAGGVVTTVEQGFYRFLAGHRDVTSGKGAQGYEDPNWEAGQPNLSIGGANHNEYLGSSTANSYGFDGGDGGNGTTAFCTGCHGNFHSTDPNQTGATWLRHPSDAVIPASGEYDDVGGAGHLYDPLSPVAKQSIDATPDTTVTVGSDMVMCLSCHRPHATPYPDLLRWDYAGNMIAGNTSAGDNYTGCFYCHTLKDDG
ncbi:MAG: cytochrome c3 family protein [Thermodesulfobacteriota bacterium]|nr:cytochrome c3 family protein [Thermodesulfobacteriota bacterium]